MSALAHSEPEVLNDYFTHFPLPDYQYLREPEIGLMQVQGRMGGTGERFFIGDCTITRAVICLENGLQGYSYIKGRDKNHAGRCAVIDALLQDPAHHDEIMLDLISRLETIRDSNITARQKAVNASKVDFFTLVRGDNL
ncbi:MAG: Alpha-D-ribose 1-methylphosphonate 5-triphosphate synthase subunit PhnG [Candidatus Erwinia impunctatus]|nr:Alpha-D-ribose 1-methylphosphonate 5-triphosphate synthase subunit PhnG [Culicoides impunctatus]